MFKARFAVGFGVLLLIATAVNVPLALLGLPTRLTTPNMKAVRIVSGPGLEWPWRPPAVTGQWPVPDQVDLYPGWLMTHTRVGIRSGGYVMEVSRSGFPLRVLVVPHMWWPDGVYTSNDPANPPDPGPRFLVAGLVLNPLIVAGVAWVVLGAPFEVFFVLRRGRRLRRGLCPYCAYPAGQGSVCSECGRPVVAPLRA